MNSGIYKITNLINNKIYIGSSCNIYKRWNRHKTILLYNKHDNKYLQNAFNKYGIENFQFEVIEFVENKEKLIEHEQYYLDLYKSYYKENGYNINQKADSPLGLHLSEETKGKIREKCKNRKDKKNLCQ